MNHIDVKFDIHMNKNSLLKPTVWYINNNCNIYYKQPSTIHLKTAKIDSPVVILVQS